MRRNNIINGLFLSTILGVTGCAVNSQPAEKQVVVYRDVYKEVPIPYSLLIEEQIPSMSFNTMTTEYQVGIYIKDILLRLRKQNNRVQSIAEFLTEYNSKIREMNEQQINNSDKD